MSDDTAPNETPEESADDVLKCIYCDAEISAEELEGDEPKAMAMLDLSKSDLGVAGKGVYSTTEGAHVACSAQNMVETIPQIGIDPNMPKLEEWEARWGDVIAYVSAVRERVRAAAEPPLPEQPEGAGVVALRGTIPAPVRPLHIGHPTVEAWFHLFELEVVAKVRDVLAPRLAPSEDEQIFGHALPLPSPDTWMNEPPPMGFPDLKEQRERCESLLPIIEAGLVALKGYCKEAQRLPPPPLVLAVHALQNEVSQLRAQLADATAKERAFGPTF